MISKALEVNLACSRVDVTIDEKYAVLQEVMERYYGLREGLETFLKEICHPYKNWEFIVKEARGYALNYFHVLEAHPKGPEAATLLLDIFFQAIESSPNEEVRANAVDNLLLFIQKIIKEGKAEPVKYLAVVNGAFEKIRCYSEETFLLFVRSFYQLKKTGEIFSQSGPPSNSFGAINSLLIDYYRYTYTYWLEQDDPQAWFAGEAGQAARSTVVAEMFMPISHDQLGRYQEELERITQESSNDSEISLKRLIALPGYGDIVAGYQDIPKRLFASRSNESEGNLWKLLLLLHIMNIEGLSSIHEETLRDINRTVGWLIHHEDLPVIKQSLEKTFTILRNNVKRFPAIALNCVLNMGHGVYKTDDSDLVDFFMDSVVSLGFQAPEIRGVGDDWQVRANSAHVQNIRTWLQLIALKPKWSKKLLSSLIIQLSLTGVLIKDTDLFPRDITQFLNSDIGPVYNLTKQVTRLFPSYFNDIGAEGGMRDISTQLDELCLRKDELVHFLRKQSHVESSNRIVGLMEATLDFWKTRNREVLRPYLPPNIYLEVETEGLYIDGVNRIMTGLFQGDGLRTISDLLHIDEERLKGLAGEVPGASDLDLERVRLAVSFYKMLYQKYHLSFLELDSYLAQLQQSGLPDLGALRSALKEPSTERKLIMLLDYLEKLKEIILSPVDYEIREDIYRKRHFTVDIPSMYGSYHEMKFDALGLTFRLESLVNVLFEEIIEGTDLKVITRTTFSQIHDYLRLFQRALKLDGISSLEIERQLDLLSHSLEIRGFSASQYLDIFRGFSQAVHNIVNDYFNNTHQLNLLKVLEQLPAQRLRPKYLPPDEEKDGEKLVHRVTEIFLRDRIASSLGLQQFDLFLTRILNTLYHQSKELPKESLRLLLSYDPQKVLTPISPIKQGINEIIHLGNKGFNLVRIKDYGLPVPPGFIITTELFRCRDVVYRYPDAKKNFEDQVAREVAAIEGLTKKSYGNHQDPLLLSVRSGAAISQPGMMNTFLDVGINEELVAGLIAQNGNQWFGWDTYRRFLQSYGMAFGLQRDDFDAVIAEFKERLGVPYKRNFTGQQMKEVALKYKSLIRQNGIEIEEDPFKQLHLAIEKVLESWDAAKAETYRKIMGISDDWGTAVTVQAMVFGNFSHLSGSGVFFTHSPRWPGDMVLLWGDFTTGNQGEDVVSGLVKTFPISKKQAEIENREEDGCLESLFPEIYHSLRDWAKELIYNRRWSPQEMEFTFEGPRKGDLYFLQTRDMVMRERKSGYSFDIPPETPPELLGHGIGVSGGAMAGRVIFTVKEIDHWRRAEPGTSLILLRRDTVPDDIEEIHRADGLLTARGGATSHAAIVAHRLGKTCVVGCANLTCLEREKRCKLGGTDLQSGDWISIDGLEGSVYLGRLNVTEMERE